MAGVVSAQQLGMEDETMRDASLLSSNGTQIGSAFASPAGDPMDISPAPAMDQQHQHVEQQSSDQVFKALPHIFPTGDHRYLDSASGYVKPDDGKASLGVQTRSTIFQPPSRFSPKNRSSLRNSQLKRIPLAVQAKLPTPSRSSGVSRNFRPLSTKPLLLPSNQHHNNDLAMNGTFSSMGFNHRNLPAQSFPVDRQLFRPADPMPMSTHSATGAPAGATISQATDETAANSTLGTTTATATGQPGGEAPRDITDGPSLRRKRFIEEEPNDIGTRHPMPYVSPKYRRIGQCGLGSAPTSSTQAPQHETLVKDGSHVGIFQQPNVAPAISSNFISPFKPNISVNNSRSMPEANKPKATESWCDMQELDEAFREQGITPPKEEPPRENTPHQDPLKENPQAFYYIMPGSWPDDSLNFPESIIEGSHPPAQVPALSGDHGSLMSGALVDSPGLVSTASKPIASMSLQGSHIQPISSQDGETPQTQSPEAAQKGQSEDSTSQPSTWWDQLYRIYANSWGATQSVVTTAMDIAGSVKRRAVAIFERPNPNPRRPNSATSSSPTRANLRTLPEEQRRRVKSNQWRKERGLPTVQDYPFPQLSLDIPQLPATAAPSPKAHILKPEKSAHRNKHSRKRSTSSGKDTKRQSTKAGIHKRSLVQSVSPNMKRRMHMRPMKRNVAHARLDRSMLHAVESGKCALDELPVKRGGPVAARDHKAKQRPRSKRAATKKVRFVLEPDDPSLVGHHLHPEHIATNLSVEAKENEPPEPVVKEKPEYIDPGLHSWLQSEFPFGRPVSAVRLFARDPIPPGRTESIYATEWRKIEEEEKKNQLPARIRPVGPPVRPLPGTSEIRLAEVKALPNNRQVATTLSGDPLTKRDVATCYMPMAWLNDEIINAYLAILIHYLRRAHGNAGRNDKPKFHAFNSFFFSNLRDKGYASVRRWAQRSKIGGEALLNVDTVFIPVHNCAHWTLMVVKPTSRTIEYFDSLGSDSTRHLATVKEWLRGELLARYVDGEWSVVPSVSPQQDNGSDCGVFLLSTAKAVAIGLEPLSYGAKDIPLLRRKIVAELMAGGLDGDFNPVGETGEVLM